MMGGTLDDLDAVMAHFADAEITQVQVKDAEGRLFILAPDNVNPEGGPVYVTVTRPLEPGDTPKLWAGELSRAVDTLGAPVFPLDVLANGTA